MNNLIFSFKETCGLSSFDIAKESGSLDRVLDLVNEAARLNNYDSLFASINAPFDKKIIQKIKKLASKYKYVSCVIVIGIGGSNLGTVAVQEAVLGKLYNSIESSKPKIFYADNIDPDYLTNIITIIKKEAEKKNKVLVNCVTKSGTTAESISNFSIILEVLKKNIKEYKDYVVITTDKGSKLWDTAEKEGYALLEVPKNIGGRYSVFTSVSLFPLAVLGIKIEKLLDGARMMRDICIKNDLFNNPASVSALVIYLNSKRNRNICNTFLFSSDLESAGKWYRQLMAETIGKEKDINGKTVRNGITPTVCVGATDLHSMAQLYLGGPDDKITTFVSADNFKEKLKVASNKFSSIVDNIANKELGFIMNAVILGVERAYENKGIPFMRIRIKEKSEYFIGQLLQMKMLEVIYLAYLMNVNPFDQPNVEEYKAETRKLLGS